MFGTHIWPCCVHADVLAYNGARPSANAIMTRKAGMSSSHFTTISTTWRHTKWPTRSPAISSIVKTAFCIVSTCIGSLTQRPMDEYSKPWELCTPCALYHYHDGVIKWKHFPRCWPFVQHTKPVTRSFDDIFELRLIKSLSKQSWGWWFETQSRSLWRHCNIVMSICMAFRYFNHEGNIAVHPSLQKYQSVTGKRR